MLITHLILYYSINKDNLYNNNICIVILFNFLLDFHYKQNFMT